MSQKVTPFMGGLGIDATSKFEIQSNATVTVGDGTTTGNVVIGGEVGIGTTSPTTKVQVNGGIGSTGLGAISSTSFPAITMFYDTDNDYGATSSLHNGTAWKPYVIRSAGMIFKTSSDVEAMRIDSSGNLGIGTDSPSTTLDVAGDVSLGTNSSNTITLTGSVDLAGSIDLGTL